MRVAIGSDHRGFHAKEYLKRILAQMGHEVLDFGTPSDGPTDYPDYALPVAQAVAAGRAERGVLLCGSGIGMCMTANKVHGVRAALCHDELTAEMSRRHNDANVLCLGGDLLGEELMRRMLEIWMATDFDGGRHERRIRKVMQVEAAVPGEEGPQPKPVIVHAKPIKGAKKG